MEPSNDEIAKIQTDELFDTERRIGDLLARIREKKESENKYATTGNKKSRKKIDIFTFSQTVSMIIIWWTIVNLGCVDHQIKMFLSELFGQILTPIHTKCNFDISRV